MERMNRVVNTDREGMTATVEAGVLLGDLQKAVEAEGLLYPPDPTEWSCQIGGNIATNASGARRFKYGATRNWVSALKVVLADGDLVELRRGEVLSSDGVVRVTTSSGRAIVVNVPTYERPNVTKNASGYFTSEPLDAIDLFIGSEGTLGVIVEAELKLVARPEGTFSGVVFFARQDDLLGFVDEVRELSTENRKDPAQRLFEAMSAPVDFDLIPGVPRRGGCVPDNELLLRLKIDAALIEY